jgi:hypothetical protein
MHVKIHLCTYAHTYIYTMHHHQRWCINVLRWYNISNKHDSLSKYHTLSTHAYIDTCAHIIAFLIHIYASYVSHACWPMRQHIQHSHVSYFKLQLWIWAIQLQIFEYWHESNITAVHMVSVLQTNVYYCNIGFHINVNSLCNSAMTSDMHTHVHLVYIYTQSFVIVQQIWK